MPRSRKWLITINNPIEHDFDHARIKAAVLDLPSVVYWCMCDEQGDECETLHTHVYLVTENQLTHTQIDARFPSFHRDIARGKSSENRAYRHTQQQNCQDWPSPVRGPLAVKKSRLAVDGK